MNESRYILVVDSVLYFLYVEYLYRRNPICSIADGVDPGSLDQHKLPHHVELPFWSYSTVHRVGVKMRQ